MTDKEKPFAYARWLARLKHAFIAAGYFRYNQHGIRIDQKAFRPFYEDGYTPIETALIDLEEGGE